MAYSNRDSQNAVGALVSNLAIDPVAVVADFLHDANFVALIPDEEDRIELTHARLGKEWSLNGTVQLPTYAVGSFDLTGTANAAGDGLVGFGINSVTYLSSTDGGNAPAGQTPIEAARELADSVNNYTHPVVRAIADGAGLVTFTAISSGSAEVYSVDDKTTDSTMTGPAVDNVDGGLDLALTGDIVKGVDGSAFQGSTKV